MAVRTYSVTAVDVLQHVPADTSLINATSTPVSSGDIIEYIEDVAGDITAALISGGFALDSLNDDTTSQVQSTIEAGAAAMVMSKLGMSGTQSYRTLHDRYENRLKNFRSNSSSLATARNSTKSNVKTSSDKRPADFIGLKTDPF
jgi:hypothetical protein